MENIHVYLHRYITTEDRETRIDTKTARNQDFVHPFGSLDFDIHPFASNAVAWD